MARPLWLRLFGPNAPTTLDEFRESLLNAPIGQGAADGQILANFRALLNLPPPVDRPSQRDPDGTRELPLRDVPIAGANVVVARQPSAVDPAEPVRALATTPVIPADIRDPEPHQAVAADNHRTFSVQVELPWPLAYGLAPITADSASEANREPNGWLEKVLHDRALTSSIAVAFTADDPAIGTPPHWENWAGPAQGTLTLAGDYAGGFVLTPLPFRVDTLSLTAGNNYSLAVGDDFVAAGGTLVIDGSGLGAGEHVLFDGVEESDGRFIFYGSDAGDIFMGGGGNDLIEGRGGADVLIGGGGSDTFAYHGAAESSGAGYDILADFDPGSDRIDLEVEVSGFDAAITGGALSTGSFAADLTAALAGLGAGRAVAYTPDAGDLAGTLFLIVDANGIAGYQEGEDYVFALTGTTPADLGAHPDFFI